MCFHYGSNQATNESRNKNYDEYTLIYDWIVLLLSLTGYVFHIVFVIELYNDDSNSNDNTNQILFWLSIGITIHGRLRIFGKFRSDYLTGEADMLATAFLMDSHLLNEDERDNLPPIQLKTDAWRITMIDQLETPLNLIFYFLLPYPLLTAFAYFDHENEEFSLKFRFDTTYHKSHRKNKKSSIFLLQSHYHEFLNGITDHDELS